MSDFERGAGDGSTRYRRHVGGSRGRIDGTALKELQEFWERFFCSDEYRENLKRRILDGQAQSLEIHLLNLVYGKPKETLDVHHQGDGVFILKIGAIELRRQAIADGKVVELKGDGLEALTGGEPAEAGGR